MSAGNPRGPVVLAGSPSDPTGVACDVAHLVANGTAVVAVSDPNGPLAAAFDALGVAAETLPAPSAVEDVPPGVVAVVPPADGGDAAALTEALGATLVALDEGCVAGCDSHDVTPVDAGGAPKNPVLSVLPTASPDGGVEVAP